MIHRADQGRRLRLGIGCGLLMTGVGAVLGGPRGAVAAAIMGGVALLVQLVAARVMWRTGVVPSVDHLKVYGLGVALRFSGVALMGVLLARYPEEFPLVASAAGYLGTVLPLLLLETRLGR